MWIRHQDLHILAENFDMYILDDRFRIYHNEESKEWILHINSVELKDNGTYECQVPMQPVKSYTFRLDIKGMYFIIKTVCYYYFNLTGSNLKIYDYGNVEFFIFL